MATTKGIELKKNNIVAQKEAKTVKGMLETPAFKFPSPSRDYLI